ncbi:hypothetical protein ACTFIR_011044 [Dictyostelium discoideum]
MDIKEIVGDYNSFLDTIFELLIKGGFKENELKELPIDHICYRVSTNEFYNEKKKQLNQLGELLVETEIGGRMISTFKLNKPIQYKDKSIPLIELPAPKKNRINYDGLEHIEMVINEPFQSFVDNHPSPINDENLKFNWVLHALNKDINPDVECEFIDPRIKNEIRTISVKFHHQSLEEVVKYEIQLLNENKQNK